MKVNVYCVRDIMKEIQLTPGSVVPIFKIKSLEYPLETLQNAYQELINQNYVTANFDNDGNPISIKRDVKGKGGYLLHFAARKGLFKKVESIIDEKGGYMTLDELYNLILNQKYL